MNETNPYAGRRRGERRLSALTVGVTAASLLGVGAVAAYDAQLFGTHLVTSGTSESSRDDDGGSQQLQPSTVAPATTQQAPAATSGGS